MPSLHENNKRIAQNTAYLYFRMAITMAVSLYTSRVVLSTLGVSDYGIQNVMGGVIGMLTYVNTLLSGGTSRFITMDLGRGDMEELKKTFSISNTLAVAAAAFILILGETVGLWFMTTQLNLDPSRMDAAVWVYQGALMTCVLTVLQTPFTASLIAHEKMAVYAYMSIFDVTMKLLTVYLLLVIDYDKLIVYAMLLAMVDALNFMIYVAYCHRRFAECRFTVSFDKSKFKEMMTYSGWNMVGAFANLLNSYGLNILINIFFGTVVNAARGIALQVSSIVTRFYSNFQTATRPQIMKYYAQGDVENMSHLICNNSKYCTLLLLCLVVPISFNVDGLLYIWLGQRPEYTSWFVRLILLQIIFQSIDLPVGMGIHAVGKMKLPNLTAALLYICVFPFTYVLYRYGVGVVAGYAVYLAFTPFILFTDLLILRHYTGFSIRRFAVKTLLPVMLIGTLGSISSVLIDNVIVGDGTLVCVAKSATEAIAVAVSVFYLGLTKRMRTVIIDKVRNQ